MLSSFPSLVYTQWQATHSTLHRFLQIVGKLRLKHMPPKNHWWYITLYVNSRGLGTGPIPQGQFTFEIQFNFIKHRLEVYTSNGDHRHFDLYDGLSVAEFYQNIYAILQKSHIDFDIIAHPYDLEDDTPFEKDHNHHTYDKKAVTKAWQLLSQIDMIFKEFGGRSYAKTCPVHLYWHHFDLVITRFSGKKGPSMQGASKVERHAYSHEVISFGFWFGDQDTQEAAFYSYTYPSPKGIDDHFLAPDAAKWIDANGSPMAFLPYAAVLQSKDPRKAILSFLESAYQAGAKSAGWDINGLEVKD